MTPSSTIPTRTDTLLHANLASLSLHAPHLARLIAETEPRPGLEWADTQQGPVASLDARWLASRRRPQDEAERLAESVDVRSAGCVAVLGFGLGLHVAALARRMGRAGLVVVFEPDIPLLRAVLERIDHSAWLSAAQVRFVTGAQDAGAITAALHGAEPFVALGVKMLEHPPSRVRLAHLAPVFSQAFAASVAAVRTVVVTTMVQTEVTIRNAFMNIDHYLAGEGVADLAALCAGQPAVVVAAGPSLARTIDALADPALRDRCVIIAVQTALKQLLAKGIKPHFVTALDYHRISARFYEGLTPGDVEGVTLIAEPKVHPSVPGAFPGVIRCPSDENLDILLGDLAGVRAKLPPGSTVAHLAYYMARHLGCDPVILTGQDLGFTDGQYYSAGAAIHNVWACELSPFSTLEMFEWERIARGKSTLRRATDHLGRPVYTDEQMATYLAQFERDFLHDSQRGAAIIDATEGGVSKRHTTPMTIREALERFAPPGSPALPAIPGALGHGGLDARVRARAVDRLGHVRRDAGRMAVLSRKTATLLAEARDNHQDRRRVARLVDAVHALRDEAHGLDPAFALVQRLNQTGAFNRARADRDIELDDALTPLDRERRQIERDIVNVGWLADAADTLAHTIDDAVASLTHGVKRDTPQKQGGPTGEGRAKGAPQSRVAAVLVEDLSNDDGALRTTVSKLAECDGVDAVIVLTSDRARAASRLGDAGGRARVEQAELSAELARTGRIRAARAFSRDCWRGGIGAMTCYDESLCPRAAAAALEAGGFTAALIVPADARALDTGLCAAIIDRHREDPARHRIAFSQAPPGVAGFLIDRALLAEIAAGAEEGAPFASIGGLLRYAPTRPTGDPIARPVCVPIDHALRDGAPPRPGAAPAHLVLELSTARRSRDGALARWLDLPERDEQMPTDLALRLVRELGGARSDAALTLAGRGDPLRHPDARTIIEGACEAGVASIHVRTDLLAGDGALDSLIAAAPDVVSVDLFATTAPTYAAIVGVDALSEAMQRVQRLYEARRVELGAPTPWIVARATRCDLIYEEIEAFYDGWTMQLGACALDPLPRAMPGERIAPLPPPASALARLERQTIVLRADGRIARTHDERACGDALDARPEPLPAAWRTLLDARGIQ